MISYNILGKCERPTVSSHEHNKHCSTNKRVSILTNAYPFVHLEVQIDVEGNIPGQIRSR